MRANLAAFRRWRLVPRFLRDVAKPRPGRRAPRPPASLARPAGADRRPGHPPSRGRARHGPGGGLDGGPPGGQHRLVPPARGDRGRDGRRPALVPALLAPERRARREPPLACPASRLRRHRRDPRHVPARLARTRHPERLPAVPPRRGPGELPHRPRLLRRGRRPIPRQDPSALSNTSPRSSPTPRAPGPTWPGCARRPRCRSSSRASSIPTTPGRPWTTASTGVIVSNHGGRQLDGAIAALDALPQVVRAVGDRTAVLFDSGIRRGADVIKAVALGARAVLLGRPYAYGLAVGGEQGVREVLSEPPGRPRPDARPGGLRLVPRAGAGLTFRPSSRPPGSKAADRERSATLHGAATQPWPPSRGWHP